MNSNEHKHPIKYVMTKLYAFIFICFLAQHASLQMKRLNQSQGIYVVTSDQGPLQWRHNYHDGVSNHQPDDCLLKRLFRRRAKKTSMLHVTGLCGEKHRWPVNPPHRGPVTRKMFPFDGVIMSIKLTNFWCYISSLPLPLSKLIYQLNIKEETLMDYQFLLHQSVQVKVYLNFVRYNWMCQSNTKNY